jgi:outer membrane protein OmpA-like peptidoglycan-associated protein
MACIASDGQPRDAGAFIQARRRLAALVCVLCISACSNYHTTGPEAWWHETIGGKIAQNRPPPPGDKDPYPNLSTVPPKPAKPDNAVWNRMTAGLITDRTRAKEAAALAPIPTAMSAPPAPAPLDIGQPRATSPGASAALVGASPPVATAGKPAGKAPSGASRATAPLSAADANAAAPTIRSAAGEAAFVADGRLPALPTREPARPDIAPAPPPPLVPVTAMPPAAAPFAQGGSEIDFARGSAALDDPALAEVKALAAARGDLGVAVTGYGDAASSDAIGQSDALGLGLARAQALATALVAQGVPYARLRLNAEAAGRGANLRLLQ